MIGVIFPIGILVIAFLTVWISARMNGITIWEYFRLYGGELIILSIVTIVLIILIIGGIL